MAASAWGVDHGIVSKVDGGWIPSKTPPAYVQRGAEQSGDRSGRSARFRSINPIKPKTWKKASRQAAYSAGYKSGYDKTLNSHRMPDGGFMGGQVFATGRGKFEDGDGKPYKGKFRSATPGGGYKDRVAKMSPDGADMMTKGGKKGKKAKVCLTPIKVTGR